MSSHEVWNDFHDKVFNFVRKRINSHDDVRDIVQEIFLKIHLNLHALTNRDKLASWIHQIVRNAVADFYKKKKRQITIALPDMPVIEPEGYMNEEFAEFVKPFVEQLECTH